MISQLYVLYPYPTVRYPIGIYVVSVFWCFFPLVFGISYVPSHPMDTVLYVHPEVDRIWNIQKSSLKWESFWTFHVLAAPGWLYIYICINMYIYIYMYMCISVYVYYICICNFICIYIYIYIYKGFLTWEGTLLHHPVVMDDWWGGAPREDRRATPRSVLEHRPGQGI